MGLSSFNAMRARMKAQKKLAESELKETASFSEPTVEPVKAEVSETILEKADEIELPSVKQEQETEKKASKKKTDAEKLKKKKE